MRRPSEVLVRIKKSAYSGRIDESSVTESPLCVCVHVGLWVKVYGSVSSRV